MTSNIFFTSDTHFFHENIIRYCSRPFSNKYEMNEVLIKNWNKLVSDKDTVYHLGDFGFGDPAQLHSIRQRLNGQINFIRGNHDKQFKSNTFNWVKDYYELYLDDTLIVMSHYPMLTWNKEHRGSIMLSGHTHSASWQVRPDYKGINVGVDAWGYQPIPWAKLKKLIDSIKPKIDFRERNV